MHDFTVQQLGDCCRLTVYFRRGREIGNQFFISLIATIEESYKYPQIQRSRTGLGGNTHDLFCFIENHRNLYSCPGISVNRRLLVVTMV